MKATLNGNVVDRNDVVSVDNSAKNIFHDTRINDSPKNVIQNDYYQVTKPLMVYNKPHRKITYSGYDFVTEPPKTNNFPLKECYTNNSGFMCCNPQLERVILDAFNKLKLSQGGRWQKCNTQSIANEIQSSAQSKFNKTFETIAGIGDYASKSHFYSNLICKVEQGGRFMLAYATPVQAPVKVTAETEMMPY
uniref:Ground-like domain-containing protein n=1 Tax=Rhabditophanes sp. KR3021 TaxID=114890 RepID=A0AC35TXI1_9BILA